MPAIAVCGVASAVHLFKNRPAADRLAVSAAELAVLFGAMGLVTGPLWGRKAWGVWWQWDARLTMALLLELVFISYLLVRAYGGPGIGQAGGGRGPLRDGRVAVRLCVGEHLAHGPSAEHRGPEVDRRQHAGRRSGSAPGVAFLSLFALLLTLRVNLASQQALLDELYLAEDDGAV